MTGLEIVLSTLLSITSVSLLVLFAKYHSLKNESERNLRELLILHERHNSLSSSTSREIHLLKEQNEVLKDIENKLKQNNVKDCVCNIVDDILKKEQPKTLLECELKRTKTVIDYLLLEESRRRKNEVK